MAEDKNTTPRGGRIWLLVAAVVGILILGDLNRRMGDARQLERDAQSLHTEVATLEADQGQLETQVAGATSEAVVEAWARQEAKMIRPGERLVIPLPGEGGAQTTPVPPSSAPPLPSSWQVWWALLFGS
jgi:cell division protein FtsB